VRNGSKRNSKKGARVKAQRGAGIGPYYHKKPWWLYILECSDKTLYVVDRARRAERLHVHNTGKTCRYTRVRKPLVLKYQEKCSNHNAAMKRERQIKSFPRAKKLRMIEKSSSP
jgi:putative endonuclease